MITYYLGSHYQRTLEAWLQFMDSKKVTVLPMLGTHALLVSVLHLLFYPPFLDTMDSLLHPLPVTNLPYSTTLAFLSAFFRRNGLFITSSACYKPTL